MKKAGLYLMHNLFSDLVVDQLRTLSEYGGGDKNQASQLAVYPQSIGKPPQKYAWLASGGIRMGAIKLTDAYKAFDIGATLPYVICTIEAIAFLVMNEWTVDWIIHWIIHWIWL